MVKAAVVTGVLGVVAALVTVLGGHVFASGPAAPSALASSPTLTPLTRSTSPASSADGLPTGWQIWQDKTGFSVAVPAIWAATQTDETSYTSDMLFGQPDGHRSLDIGQSSKPQRDPIYDLRYKEKSYINGGQCSNYHRIRLEAVTYGHEHDGLFASYNAADLEYTCIRDGISMHVQYRDFVVIPGKLAYAIIWSSPVAEWQSQLTNLQLVLDSFSPAKTSS